MDPQSIIVSRLLADGSLKNGERIESAYDIFSYGGASIIHVLTEGLGCKSFLPPPGGTLVLEAA